MDTDPRMERMTPPPLPRAEPATPRPQRSVGGVDPRFDGALAKAKGMLETWSLLTLMLALPLLFVAIFGFGLSGWSALLPVAWLFSLGFAGALSLAWADRWSRMPIRAAARELGGIVGKWAAIALLVVVVAALLGTGIPGGG